MYFCRLFDDKYFRNFFEILKKRKRNCHYVLSNPTYTIAYVVGTVYYNMTKECIHCTSIYVHTSIILSAFDCNTVNIDIDNISFNTYTYNIRSIDVFEILPPLVRSHDGILYWNYYIIAASMRNRTIS